MANFYSNCGTLTTGCFLYTNQALTTPVSNGKYSDGTNCYDVTGGSGEITSFASCPPPETLYVNAGGADVANGAGEVTVKVRIMDSTSFGGNPVTGITNLSVSVTAVDSGATSHTASINIYAGYSCGVGLIYTSIPDIPIDEIIVNSVSPSSAGNQTYNVGSGYRDLSWSCN